MHSTKSAAIEFAEFLEKHPETAAVDALVIDVNGKMLGKRIPTSEARHIAEAGLHFSAVTPLLDTRGLGQNAGGRGRSDGDPDSNYTPVGHTLRPVPWARRKIAQWLCAPASGPATEIDPRRILQTVIAMCLEDGIRPVVACELECYLIAGQRSVDGQPYPAPLGRTGRAPSPTGGLSVSLLEDLDDLLEGIELAARDQRLPVTGIVSEGGAQQIEINLDHSADVLAVADHAVMLRRLVQGVARARGLDATFMAKPFLEEPGSGLHVHLSIVDDAGKNRFGAKGGDRLLRHAIGGLEALFHESYALFVPNINSHRRMKGPFVSASPNWGENNRSVAFRIPSSGPSARRFEHRVAGADASPHLVLAAILAGLHFGLTQGCEPAPEVVGCASPADEPRDFFSAVTELEQSTMLSRYIPSEYLTLYAELKRRECREIMQGFLPHEHDFYL